MKTYKQFPKAKSADDLKAYEKPMQSWLPKKKLVVKVKDGNREEVVHFGHTDYDDYTQHKDDERREDYLSRSAGIRDDEGNLTRNDKFSANYWSRKILWNA